MKKVLSYFFVLLLNFLLVSCAQQPIERELTPGQEHKRAQQSAKLHTELAAQYYYRGQHKVAIEEVNEALRAVSNYAPAFNMLGLIYMSLNEDEQARENFEQALKFSPKDPEIHNNYGWFLCQRMPGQVDKAVTHFLAASNDPLYETPEKSYTNAGICELKRRNFDGAGDYLRKALSMNPSYPPALVGLIEVDYRNGRLKEAKTKLSRHLQHAAPTAESLWLAILIERKLGDRYAEESYTYQLIKRFPNSKEALALREGRYE